MKDALLNYCWIILQHIMPSKLYLGLKYLVVFKKRLNWRDPLTFSEKLQWLKLYDYRPEYTRMVDKIEMKEYVSELLGPQYVIPLIRVWNSVEEVELSDLPQKFVLKCNHDSGNIIICNDKSEIKQCEVKRMLGKMLRSNYYLMGRETPYKYVKKKIFAEKYMEDNIDVGLIDYKIHNFNGEPKVILVCRNRYSSSGLEEDFFSPDWHRLDLRRPGHPNSPVPLAKPEGLDEMLRLSRILSNGIPFLRVDFYIINRKVYIGELTFFPSSGFVPFVPEEWDHIMGSWLTLPSKEQKTKNA